MWEGRFKERTQTEIDLPALVSLKLDTWTSLFRPYELPCNRLRRLGRQGPSVIREHLEGRWPNHSFGQAAQFLWILVIREVVECVWNQRAQEMTESVERTSLSELNIFQKFIVWLIQGGD